MSRSATAPRMHLETKIAEPHSTGTIALLPTGKLSYMRSTSISVVCLSSGKLVVSVYLEPTFLCRDTLVTNSYALCGSALFFAQQGFLSESTWIYRLGQKIEAKVCRRWTFIVLRLQSQPVVSPHRKHLVVSGYPPRSTGEPRL